MSDSPYVITVTADNFEQVVLAQSHTVPVLADFWADWCQPCQALMPVLMQMAETGQGSFIVAKINADEQQSLAMQYEVRSLPTLKIFHNGKVVSELLGAQPESEIWHALDPYISRATDDTDDVETQAHALSTAGEHEQAELILRTAIEAEPENFALQQSLAQALLLAGQYDNARTLLNNLPKNRQEEPRSQQLLLRLNWVAQIETAPNIVDLEAAIAADDSNLKAHLQLSTYKVLSGEYADAMDHLLLIMRKDRKFEEDAGRKGLLDIFTLLGDDPLVNQYRSQLSSLLF